MKKIFRSNSIIIRVFFPVSLVAILMVVLFVIVFYFNRQMDIKRVDRRMNSQLDDIENLISAQITERQTQVNSSLEVAHYYFYNQDSLQILDSTIETQALNQITKATSMVNVRLWKIGEAIIHNDVSIVDSIQKITNAAVTIFQKIPEGFLRISTNVINDKGTRATGTFIPNDSPVIQTIMSKKTFSGRAFVVDDWYLTSYEPIIRNNEVIGILFVGVKEKDMAIIRKIFHEKVYYGSGHPFLVSEEGELLIHPNKEGEFVDEASYFKSMQDNPTGKLVIQDNLNHNKTTKWIYYKYFDAIKSYISIEVVKKDIFGELNRIWFLTLGLAFIISISALIMIYYVLQRNLKPVGKIAGAIEKLAKGQRVEKFSMNQKNEITKISDSLNLLIDGLNDSVRFAKEIEQGKLDSDFKPLSDHDDLGNALLEMRQSIIKAREDELVRKAEDEKRSWSSHGLAKFADILRQNNDDVKRLSFNVIQGLIEYIDANQGGVFVLSDDDSPILEMTACYAYDRQKFLEQKIKIGQGLVGACFQEKKPVYLKKIPNDYIKIASGLGQEKPKELFIVPLIVNDEIYGVLEIASFYEIEDYKREFVEKVAESIASTISSVKINVKTTQLLQKSQEQAEEMRAQEEEMRQNMEELQATQESLADKEKTQRKEIEDLNRKNAEALESAKRKEKQYRDILESCLDSVIIIGQEGNIQFFNHSAEKYWGYSKDEVIGQNLKLLMPDSYADHHDDYLDNYINTGIKKVIGKSREIEVQKKDGTIAPAVLSLSETKLEGDRFFTGFIKDLTAEKQARKELEAQNEKLIESIDQMEAMQKELKQSEEEMAGRIDAINGTLGYLEMDPGGKIQYVNDILLEITKYPKKDLVDQPITILFEDYFAGSGSYKKMWAGLLEGKSHVGENIIVNKDQEKRWITASFTPVEHDGKTHRIVLLANDITEEKKRILDQQAQMQAIDRSGAVMELQPDGTIFYMNDKMMALLGANNPEEFIEKDHHILLSENQRKSEEYKNLVSKIEQGETVEGTFEFKTTNNEFVYVTGAYNPLYDFFGKLVKIMFFGYDVTASKKMRDDLQVKSEMLIAQEEELRQNLEELTAIQDELSRQNAEVKRKEQEHRKIMDKCPDGVIVIDESGIIEFFNLEAEKIWGFDRKEVVGKNVRLLMPEDYAREHNNYIERYVETGKKKVIGTGREVPLKLKNGEIIDGFLTLTETKIGNRSLFTGFISNISLAKEDMKAVNDYRNELENYKKQLENLKKGVENGISKPEKEAYEAEIKRLNDLMNQILENVEKRNNEGKSKKS